MYLGADAGQVETPPPAAPPAYPWGAFMTGLIIGISGALIASLFSARSAIRRESSAVEAIKKEVL